MAKALSVMDIMRKIRKELFPKEYHAAPREVMCAHVMNMCPDINQKKEEILNGYWSCITCQSFFENLFSITSKPLELLNKVLPSLLCHDNRKGCEDAFENAIQLTGALNNIFQNKTNAYSLCLTKIDCKM
ncbi:hypothetical protein B9Z55_025959 [Caenorhabditis nigoni]|uniref:Uncharacterized protein n=1 Tax=Caenorhabditis nigoni TaxID=1611254 RepID=A0A2G5T1F8_9PELO|nr:hypothetical protein B9Z55_025959 [Caenorhabditis nigoni]